MRAGDDQEAARPLQILVAGPYRSGTGDDPAKIQANVDAMMDDRAAARSGPGTCRCSANGTRCRSSSSRARRRIGDAVFDEIFHPVARRLVQKCDAVLRIGGASAGADDMVATARRFDRQVFTRIEDIPGCG